MPRETCEHCGKSYAYRAWLVKHVANEHQSINNSNRAIAVTEPYDGGLARDSNTGSGTPFAANGSSLPQCHGQVEVALTIINTNDSSNTLTPSIRMSNINVDEILVDTSGTSTNVTTTTNNQISSTNIEKNKIERYQCHACSKTFANKNTFSTHYKKFHNSLSISNNINNSNSNILQISNKTSQADSIPLDKAPLYSFQQNISNFTKNHPHFNIALININSFSKKTSDIFFLLDNQQVDILVINETKLGDLDDDSHFTHCHYEMHRRDRNSRGRGGGIMVYVKKSLKHEAVADKDVELINLVVEPSPNHKITVIACYRPPHAENEKDFFKALENRIAYADKFTPKDTIIVGDLNYDMTVGRVGSPHKLDEFISSHGLFNTITKGTRLNTSSGSTTLLDVIMCYDSKSHLTSNVFECPISDHSLVISVFNYTKPKNHCELKPVRCLNLNNLNKIKSAFLLIFSTLLLPSLIENDVNNYWNIIKDIIVSVINAKAPVKLVQIRPINKVPWYNKELVCLGKHRNKLYRKARRSKLKKDWNLYKSIRSKFASLFNLLKIKYFTNFINNNSTSTKKFWHKLNPFLNPNKKTRISHSLLTSCTSNSSVNELANVFVNFFSSIINSFTFLNHDICSNYIDSMFNTIPSLSIFLNNNNKYDIEQLEENEVINCLKELDDHAAPGAVNVKSCVFKHCAEELGPPLTKLFNACINNSMIPNEWKIAYITPIYKGKGPKADLVNYRPIAIVSPIAKVFETLLTRKMTSYLESKMILHDSQYGFRPGRSCELALNTMIEDWRESLDEGQGVVSVFLDLSKAFDTISHSLLLKKLHFYNFSSKSISLLSNYLSDRTIKVNIDGTLSKSAAMTVGVPQGSVLGPMLFILYMNDLSHLPLTSKILLYADDTTVYLSGSNLNNILKKITDDLKLIHQWLSHNRLILNLNKTQAMFFNPKSWFKSDRVKLSDLSINCDGSTIGFVSETRLLGVIIDDRLKFSSHITSVCNKINYKSHILSRNRFLFPLKFCPILFKLFIYPYFDFCSTTYLHLLKEDRKKLERCFSKAIYRTLRVNIHTSDYSKQFEILKNFNILPLSYRQFYYFTQFLYKIITRKSSNLYKKVCKYDKRSFSSNTSFPISTRNTFTEPSFKTNFSKYSFSRISVKTLNLFLNEYICNNEVAKQQKKKYPSLKEFLITNRKLLIYKENFTNFIT
jgi:hypothetical protein